MFRVYFVDKGAINFLNLKSLVTSKGHVANRNSVWKIVNFRVKNLECQNFFQSWWIKSKKMLILFLLSLFLHTYIYIWAGYLSRYSDWLRAGQSGIESLCRRDYIYTGCNRRNVRDFGRVFLMLNYIDITQNTYIQSWTVTEIMTREVWNFDSCYSLIDY